MTLRERADREKAGRAGYSGATCERCRWARFERVPYIQSGRCARAQKAYIMRKTPVCGLYEALRGRQAARE